MADTHTTTFFRLVPKSTTKPLFGNHRRIGVRRYLDQQIEKCPIVWPTPHHKNSLKKGVLFFKRVIDSIKQTNISCLLPQKRDFPGKITGNTINVILPSDLDHQPNISRHPILQRFLTTTIR